MAVIPDGCQLIARQVRESKIWVEKPAWWFKVWVHIILEVNHTSDELYQRGSAMFNYKQIKKDCHLHGIEASSIDHLIHWLRQEGMIATRKAIRGIVITVIKYEHFQNIDNYKSETKSDTKSETKSETEARRKRDYIYKNGNKEIKDTTEPQTPKPLGSDLCCLKGKPEKQTSSDEPKTNYFKELMNFKEQYRVAVELDYICVKGRDMGLLKKLSGSADTLGGFSGLFAQYFKYFTANDWYKQNNVLPSIPHLQKKINEVLAYKEVKPFAYKEL